MGEGLYRGKDIVIEFVDVDTIKLQILRTIIPITSSGTYTSLTYMSAMRACNISEIRN